MSYFKKILKDQSEMFNEEVSRDMRKGKEEYSMPCLMTFSRLYLKRRKCYG